MTEAVVDTGPVLHLHQISELLTLGIFDQLEIPKRVADELGHFGLSVHALSKAGKLPEVVIQEVERSEWTEVQEQSAVDRLMTKSTLYMGRAFRDYVQRLIRDI